MLAMIGHRIVNLDQVREIIPARDKAGVPQDVLIKFKDGEAERYSASMEYVERFTGQIVPAPEGYVRVLAGMPEKGDEDQEIALYRHPVIAFRVTGGTEPPVPITVEGEPFDTSTYAVVSPGGAVTTSGGDEHDSVEAWLAELRCRHSS